MEFLPEITLLAASLTFFTVSLCKVNSDTTRHIVIGLGFAVFIASLLSYGQTGMLFFNAYQVDLFSQVFKILIAGAMLIVILFGNKLKGISPKVQPEYYIFMFCSTLGLMMLVSSVELLTIFVTLEFASFAIYLMVPMRDDEGKFRFQMEAGIKYLLFGVTATGFMLFGMSYMFGLTGSTELSVIMVKLSTMWDNPAAVIAMMMVLCGF